DNSNLANRFAPDWEETITLEKESRSKLDKDLVKPYDYTKQNSLYENFKPSSQEYLDQVARAIEVRKKMWRKSFVKSKPNIVKNIAFLPVSKSVSKSRQAYNVMTNNINHFSEIVDQAWVKHTSDRFRAPTALDMEVLIKTCLMPLSLKTQNENFSNMYDLLLQECVSKDVMCSYLHYLSDLDAYTKFQCLYLHKVKECEYLAKKLSKQTETVNKEVHHKLLKSFSKLEQHSISHELALQQCQEQMKNDTVCKETTSNVFQKEREQYHEIQDLKAQLQDKNIAISELKKLIEKGKGKSVETKKAPITITTPATTTNTTSVTNAQLQAIDYQVLRLLERLEERDANRSTNGEDNHNLGTGVRRTKHVARECTYQDFMKCQPLYFKSTEGVVELTQCNSLYVVEISSLTVGHDVAYAMTWTNLRKKMTDKYCPRNEMKKLETELWNLKVKGTDVIGYNQRFQELALLCVRMFPEESDKIKRYDAIEMATELMDKTISTLVERQAENKRKLDNNNQAQQQSPKRKNVAQAYAAGTGERKEYAGTLPFSTTGANCTQCKVLNQGTLTCYECGNPGYYRSDCPELKNQNHGNQAEGTGARGMVYAFGGGETKQDINNIEDEIEA
ncbi:retrovirus-related pol polyprotein from transposon TNT 1-94, partial [Tanacetum coccineum]